VSDTPRTDAAIKVIDVAFVSYDGLSSAPEEHIDPAFARKLERELNTALAQIKLYEGHQETCEEFNKRIQPLRDFVNSTRPPETT